MSYLLLFFSLSLWAQTAPKIEVIPGPQKPEDFEHQFKGCLENSECDQVMGLQLGRWKELISKVEDMDNKKKAKYLELFRSKYGIPVEFYTTRRSQQGFKPLLYNSSCKAHNPKQEDQKIYRGMAFLKSLGAEKAVVWRDQTQIEVPTGELLIPQPVTLYRGKKSQTYYLPLGDQPLLIRDKQLVVLREEDGFFYVLQVAADGDWKMGELDFTRLSEWQSKKETVACPKDSVKNAHKAFGYEFCKTLWDDDLKKPVIVKMYEGC